MANERSIMRGLVKNYNIPSASGKTITVPIYPAQTAAALTEGEEISNTEVATSGVTLTVATNAIRTIVTDLSRTASASNVVADIGRLFGEAIAKKIDKDLIGLFTNFATTVGSNSTTFTPALLANAIAQLRNNSVPSENLACVIHPYVAYDLKASLTNTFANPNAGVIQNDAMRTGYVGTLFGVPVFESANITDTTGDSIGAVFHRDALGLAMIGDISIETQRRASYLGDDIIASCHYAVGEIYDLYGVKISADSTLANAA
ncbi:hypothetical protein UFOVP389_43 [uncultured Caudovirales phage]|uniref:Phage capsid n=1 Tax=uncultured Caudovirales phage TaxID=2100421 RepID=A0A6J7X4H4_9CAUD|nr:hypothetical protein UFOVP389_43 [uncultured Caudovirales phage]